MKIKIPQPKLDFNTRGAMSLLAGFVLIGNFILMLILLPFRFVIWLLDNWFLALCIFVALEYSGITNVHKIPEVQEFMSVVEHTLNEAKTANERASGYVETTKESDAN